MDILSFLRESTGRFGPVGYEQALAQWLKTQFEPYCDEVTVDAFSNVVAIQKPTQKSANQKSEGGAAPPRIMFVAHMDEVALLVTEILKDGSLRVRGMGGVDPKIFPAMTVTVHTETGGLFGVIGAKPPHLQAAGDQKKSVKWDDLYVDLGMDAEKVKQTVNIGDMVTLHGEVLELLNNRAASKTMDDRACIAVMLDAAERLQKLNHSAEVVFLCSTQEEVGGYGALTGAYSVHPDIGYILDVTFANYPGAKPDSTVPADAPAPVTGPFIQHKLLSKLKDTAKNNGIKINVELSERGTGTDTDEVEIAHDGVPCVLVGLPLSYMHTTVETVQIDAIRECGRLAAAFAADIEEGWDKDLWI